MKRRSFVKLVGKSTASILAMSKTAFAQFGPFSMWAGQIKGKLSVTALAMGVLVRENVLLVKVRATSATQSVLVKYGANSFLRVTSLKKSVAVKAGSNPNLKATKVVKQVLVILT